MSWRTGKLLLSSLVIFLSGCYTTRYVDLRLISDPYLADVSVVETGEFLGKTPDLTILRHEYVWSPFKPKPLHLRFRHLGYEDDIVTITAGGFWHSTKEGAENGDSFSVKGLLLPKP